MGTSRSKSLPPALRPAVFSSTKFLAPQPPTAMLRRPDLLERLTSADGVSLTIVVGAPGSGKSSLLSMWFHSIPDQTVTGLSADRGDTDPVRFMRGFVAALQRIEPDFGAEAADLITLDREVTADALESILVDDSTLGRRLTVVIDDFQFVSPAAADLLQQLLVRRLQNIRLVIGSRSDPMVGLPRLRLRNDLAEIREADLRLDAAETSAFVRLIGLDPASIDIEALQRRTEGWVAGVQLATLSVLGADDPAARIHELTGNNQTIAGYLTAEVLANQPEPVRRFLEDVCVVDELDVALCTALTSPTHPDEVVTLETIEAAHLLLSRVDADGTLFRFHQLFAELLRAQLRARDPERLYAQHRRAAEHFGQSKQIERAIYHYWAAGDGDAAAALVNQNMLAVYLRTEEAPLVDVGLEVSQDELLPELSGVAGYSLTMLMNGRGAQVITFIDRVERVVATIDNQTRAKLRAVKMGALTQVGDFTKAAHIWPDILAALRTGDAELDPWTTVAIPIAVRTLAWEEQFDQVDAAVACFAPGADPRVIQVDLAGALAFAELERGDIRAAETKARDAVRRSVELGVAGSGIDLAARAVLAMTLLEQGDFGAAEAEFAAVLANTAPERVPSMVVASLGRARLLRAGGHFEAALATVTSARGLIGHVEPANTVSTRLDIAEGTLRLALGDVDHAQALLLRVLPGWRALASRAWLELARRDRTAEATIDAMEAAGSSWWHAYMVALLRVRFAIDNNTPDIDQRCSDLLDHAEQTGALLPIFEAGANVLTAVTRVARRRRLTPFIERLLIMRPLPRPANQARPEYAVDELSARELIVLQYMATSMNNHEIAEALYLSVNTVKTHVKHVLRKLAAASRAEAVKRAHELHYL
jgi:LuxR family maltose regulon positive regulatory protein